MEKSEKIEAIIELYGFSRSAGKEFIREKVFKNIKDICLSHTVLAIVVDSLNELCNGDTFQPPGDRPFLIKICSSNAELIRIIHDKLREAEVRVKIWGQLLIDMD